MSDFGKRVIGRIEKHLATKFPEQSETRCKEFADSLAPAAIKQWSRRPWMRPPTQTGRRK